MIKLSNMSSHEKGGIPWDKIFDNVEKEKKPSGRVNGDSGLSLAYEVMEEGLKLRFSVRDAYDPIIYLKARAHLRDGNFGLNLRTRGYHDNPNLRHPDMHAREFVGDSLRIFRERYNFIPTHFIGKWFDRLNHRDNFDTFMRHLKNGTGVVVAAKQTWTAKALEIHNFTDIQKKDINIDVKEGLVTATFWSRR